MLLGWNLLLRLAAGTGPSLQVFAGFERVPDADLVPSAIAPPLRRTALQRYVADRVQCVVERVEARDLADIAAVVRARPDLRRSLRRAVAAQDALLLTERLLQWTDSAIRADLRAYRDIEPVGAIAMRDWLLDTVRVEATR